MEFCRDILVYLVKYRIWHCVHRAKGYSYAIIKTFQKHKQKWAGHTSKKNQKLFRHLRDPNWIMQSILQSCQSQLCFWPWGCLYTGRLGLLSTSEGSMVNHWDLTDFNSINHSGQIGGSSVGYSFSVGAFKTYDCSCAKFPPPPPYPLMITINYPLIIRAWQ